MGEEQQVSTNKEESKGNEKDHETTTKDGIEYITKNGKTYRKVKPLPKLKDMLREGAPGEIPYNEKDIKGKLMHLLSGPVALAVIFLISLAIWHKAPHHKSTHPGYKLPGFDPEGATGFELIKKLQQAQRDRLREMDKTMEQQVEEARRRAAGEGSKSSDEEF